jgi:hypothetical protein
LQNTILPYITPQTHTKASIPNYDRQSTLQYELANHNNNNNLLPILMTTSTTIINMIIIRQIVYTAAKTDIAEYRETALKIVYADSNEDIQADTKINHGKKNVTCVGNLDAN